MSEQILKQILTELQSLKQGQITLEQGQVAVQSDIAKLSESQVRMENELTEKISGLYDAREVRKDIDKDIIARLDRIETKVDKLELETSHVRLIK